MCGIFGVMNEHGRPIPGRTVIKAVNAMRDRYNGLGGGFAGYGIYPKYKDAYALHLIFSDEEKKSSVEEIISETVEIIHDERIPTRRKPGLSGEYIPWRYFVQVSNQDVENSDDTIVKLVMRIGRESNGAAVLSSGRNMGVFKATGYPLDVADFFKIDEYEAYLWLGHGRYPTNTPGWWGGAHPFSILDWSVVHNGELSSYDTNRRFLRMWGYECSLMTDTEVITYLFDLLVRKHRIPIELACQAMAPPFWRQIEFNGGNNRVPRALRMTYSSALLNGPFSIIVGRSYMMIGLTDRIKLRPLIAAKKGELSFLASEEASIRSVCPSPEAVWAPKAGSPFIAVLGGTSHIFAA